MFELPDELWNNIKEYQLDWKKAHSKKLFYIHYEIHCINKFYQDLLELVEDGVIEFKDPSYIPSFAKEFLGRPVGIMGYKYKYTELGRKQTVKRVL